MVLVAVVSVPFRGLCSEMRRHPRTTCRLAGSVSVPFRGLCSEMVPVPSCGSDPRGVSVPFQGLCSEIGEVGKQSVDGAKVSVPFRGLCSEILQEFVQPWFLPFRFRPLSGFVF